MQYQKKYIQLSEKTAKILFIFATTCLWEAGFSRNASIKTTFHKRWDVEANIRIQLSSFKPDIKEICTRVRCYHSSNKMFVLENNYFLFQNVVMLTSDDFVISKLLDMYK